MRIGEGVKLIQTYWTNCTNPKMLAQAKKDHRQHIEEMIRSGYTWGLDHQLPFEIGVYSRGELKAIHSILFSKDRKYRTKNRSGNKQ